PSPSLGPPLLSASWSPPLACGISVLSAVAGGGAAELPVPPPAGRVVAGGGAAELRVLLRAGRVVAGRGTALLPVLLPAGGVDAEACSDLVDRPVEPVFFCTERAAAALAAFGAVGALVTVLPRPAG